MGTLGLMGQSAGGGLAGGVVGAQFGDTPEERRRNMLIGMASGGLLPIGGAAARRLVTQ